MGPEMNAFMIRSAQHDHRAREGLGESPSAPGTASDNLRDHAVTVSSSAAVRALCGEILDPLRTYPVVGLTSRRGEQQPALAAAEVHAIAGDDVPIYFIPTGRPTVTLKWLLPERLNVFGGAARVWRPGASADSDPAAHPLIYDPHGVYGRRSIEALARCFRAAPTLIGPGADRATTIADEQLASELAALAHPIRLRIMRAACAGRAQSRSVADASRPPGEATTHISSHARTLHAAGLLATVDLIHTGSDLPDPYTPTKRGRQLVRALYRIDARGHD